MALKLSLKTLSVDKMGRVITVQDDTGVYSTPDNEGGYGSPNPSPGDIQGLMYTLSNYCSEEVHYLLAERTPGGFPNGTCFVVMDIDSVMGGEEVQVTTSMLGITDPERGMAKFNDGVIDINYYAYLAPVSATGVKGEFHLVGSNLPSVQDMDAVLVGTKMYHIDHNKPVGDGTILFLTEVLEQDATEVNPAYRTNTKIYLDRNSKCIMGRMSGKLADVGCKTGACNELRKKLLIIKHNRDASRLDWCEQDYAGADEKLRYAQSIGDTIHCGC